MFSAFLVSGCLFSLVRYLFITGTNAIDCLVRFISEMSYYVSNWTLDLSNFLYLATETEG